MRTVGSFLYEILYFLTRLMKWLFMLFIAYFCPIQFLCPCKSNFINEFYKIYDIISLTALKGMYEKEYLSELSNLSGMKSFGFS
jgi:hypothetical protein